MSSGIKKSLQGKWRGAHELYRYAREFGWARGIRIFFRLRAKTGLKALPLLAYRHPVWMRAGTSDGETFKKIFFEKEYALPFSFEPRVIVDLGANVGYASIFFARLYPNATVIAVEPNRENFELLERNISGYTNVRAVRAAIWHRNTSIKIENPDDSPWAYRVRETDASDPAGIPAVTLDDLCQQVEGRPIDFLKVDIEGAEKEIFSQNYESWLSPIRVIAIELHDRFKSGCSAAFYSALAPYCFKQYINGENVIVRRL